jgi:hypothetical protein
MGNLFSFVAGLIMGVIGAFIAALVIYVREQKKDTRTIIEQAYDSAVKDVTSQEAFVLSQVAQRIVNGIVDDFDDRQGFDISCLDEDIQTEIKTSLRKIVYAEIKKWVDNPI